MNPSDPVCSGFKGRTSETHPVHEVADALSKPEGTLETPDAIKFNAMRLSDFGVKEINAAVELIQALVWITDEEHVRL
jgi:hypothetical protein